MLTMARGGLVVDWEGTSGAGQGEQMLDHGSLPPWHAPGHDKRWRFGPFMAAGGFIGGCIGGFIDGCQWWCAAQPPLVQVVSVWLVQINGASRLPFCGQVVVCPACSCKQ